MVKGYVDVHAHIPVKEYLVDAGGEYHQAAARLFGSSLKTVTASEMIKEYDESGVEKIIVLGWDAETSTGLPRVKNELVAEFVKEYPDRMIGFASVDPHKGRMAIDELEHSIKDLGLRGLKLHPIAQAFYPNDQKFYPLYEKCVELEVPIIFHTGTTGWGKQLPGGGGAKLDYANPIYLDFIAADFPKLIVVMAHPSFPWTDTQLAIAGHKSNVFVDLSGYSPKYFDPTFVTHMSKLMPEKFMFGTDYPFLTPSRWLKDFESLNLKEEVRIKILRDNAVRVFRL